MTKDIQKLSIEIEPLGDRVIVMPVDKETTTKSGLIIPDTASKDRPQEGVIIAMGKGGIKDDSGKEMSNPEEFLKIGDKVLFGKYAGDDLKVKNSEDKDVEIKVLHLNSILGKIK